MKTLYTISFSHREYETTSTIDAWAFVKFLNNPEVKMKSQPYNGVELPLRSTKQF